MRGTFGRLEFNLQRNLFLASIKRQKREVSLSSIEPFAFGSLTHDVAVDERVGDAPHEGHRVEDGDVVDGGPAGHEAEEEHEGLKDAVGGEGGDPGAVCGAQVRGQPATDEAAEAEDGDDEGQVMDAEHLRDRTLQS